MAPDFKNGHETFNLMFCTVHLGASVYLPNTGQLLVLVVIRSNLEGTHLAGFTDVPVMVHGLIYILFGPLSDCQVTM